MKASLARVEAYLADRRDQLGLVEKSVTLVDCTVESREVPLDAIQFDDLEPANSNLDDSMAKVQDPL